MNNFFKEAWNQVSGENKRNTKAGEDHMTYEQRVSSMYREYYLDAKKDEKFEGEVVDANYEEIGRTVYITFEAESGGHKINGRFDCGTCDEGCCWGKPRAEGASLEVDGKVLSPEAAIIYIQKYQNTIKNRAKERVYEKQAPQSVLDAIEKEKKFIADEAEQLRVANEQAVKDRQLQEAREQQLAASQAQLDEALK